MKMKIFLVITLSASCCGCYKMPTDDDYSVVPTINNRDVTREKSQGPAPQVGY